MPRSRLAPGVALVRVPGIGPAVRTVDGTFLRVNPGGVAEEDLVAALRTPGDPTDPAVARLLRAFERAGYLAPRNPGDPTDPAVPTESAPPV
ncbi:hypothetical protein FNQ90_09380, partial [Streptomyces alkaliphilus]|nr:hypothetical protein [Streptomyces alkaliphilus]